MAYIKKDCFILSFQGVCGVLSLAVFTVLISLIFAVPASALNLDFASWRILSSAHFNIYYHNNNDGFARAAAAIAESSAVEISRTLNLKTIPKNIPLILYDAGDTPFGFTNVLKNKMWVSIALPDPAELSDKIWIESIIRHELTHYLMGAKLDKFIKLGTGRLIGWGVTPMWFIEGVAQREESGWNAVKDSAVRTAILSDKFLNLSDLQIFYFFNYQGRRLGYHIGNSMVVYMAERFGPDVISKILENTSYFKLNSFNQAFKKVTGLSLNQFFEEWHIRSLEKYKKQVEGKKSITDYARPLDFHGGLNISPAFGRDGKNLFLLSNKGRDVRRLSLFSINVETKKTSKLIDNLEDNYFLDRGSEFILFCRKSRNKFDNLVSDIFRYDIKSGAVKRVTRWLKAASPVYDYDSKTIFCVQQEAGATNLCRIDFDGNLRERVTDLGYNCAIYDIQIPFSQRPDPDKKNEKIMFLNYFKDGRFSVASLNYDKKSTDYGKIIPVTSSDSMIIKPRVFIQKDGSYKVFFIRDRGGIFNICSVTLERRNGGFDISSRENLTDFRESVIDYDFCPSYGRLAVVTQTHYGSDITLLDAGKKYAGDKELVSGPGDADDIACEKTAERGKLETGETVPSHLKGSASGTSAIKSSSSQHKYKIIPYKNNLKMEYLIPMAGSQSSKSLFGAQGRFADAIDRHIIDYQLLAGSSKYRNLTASYIYRGFKPTLGAAVYDLVRDLRPGVLENLRGADLFLNYKLFDTLVIFDLFAREISANSISPRLVLSKPELLNGENKDRGYFIKLLNYSAENSIDADIHPLNAHSVMLYHQNSTAKFNSFYRYKMSKLDVSKWMMLSGRLKNTIKARVMLATSSGDYDFQLGGHNDLRGYSTRPIIGRKAQLYSLEYSHLPINQPLQFKILSVNKVYPALFYDIATTYDDYSRAAWHKSAGVELKTRLLIFRKTPLAGKVGVAWRLGEGHEKEFYTAFDLKF
ncbi:MAG: hypothetical protein A2008_02280 [Candidatus Wallbacteria bacterium GWC2_49_35]|uniref:Peptidase MA-like domain-containing protein n=1 Tax=Candidatus Wallbacteria bacterium GWC2_49_35 TaxID=1817813 RepID=A0A1F7WRW0_9BACT|nr:MAG: hypothetical protein A2008_02280 [Candidatus Wallbacteria bacterium GWC2_49_35]HBC75346.1 hypothetical protein [Candidatus Wallbacteria bacterium]